MKAIELIRPDWPAPASIVACVSTRVGGVSLPPFDALNLALHVSDDPEAVVKNRQLLKASAIMPAAPCWLNQVHGNTVIDAARLDQTVPEGDGVYTNKAAVVCSVLTADCLPVLFTDIHGCCVAATHAGWRGLANGVLEATVASLPVPVENILAWMGPAIGPEAFEVGTEVRDAFLALGSDAELAFRPAKKPAHWYANLYQLARAILSRAGVTRLYGGGFCTYTESARFFSYRRDGQTGRMASSIWIAS
ncbi:MAG: peptidoglycan editing factor PgeF [Gammaproteobacteria bacterium]